MTDINKLIEEERKRYDSDTFSFFSEEERVIAKAEFASGANFILHQNRWRKVEEELPPSYENVIFKVNVFAKTYQSEMASIGSISVSGDYNLQIDLQKPDIIEYEVTEWKPIS